MIMINRENLREICLRTLLWATFEMLCRHWQNLFVWCKGQRIESKYKSFNVEEAMNELEWLISSWHAEGTKYWKLIKLTTIHFIRSINTIRITITSPTVVDAVATGAAKFICVIANSRSWTNSNSYISDLNEIPRKTIFRPHLIINYLDVRWHL